MLVFSRPEARCILLKTRATPRNKQGRVVLN
uniref:Uncharacterized protein n=1 Tax=Anguilla anguilla TaxID=7936 RepID=A0A0E9QW08_ANGAN